jgi:predicted nucleotidyltransferase component of viral defense system
VEQTILTPHQVNVLKSVSREPRLQNFYLSGGTALAEYYLHHRLSDDLDFFTTEKPDIPFLHQFTQQLKNELHARELRFERLYDRNLFFFIIGDEELKMEFTQYPFNQLDPLLIKNGFYVDSLRDIAANKLMALLDRFDPKDFVDLFFILSQFELQLVRKDTETKFGITIADLFLGSEFAKVKRVQALPKMIKPVTIDELRRFFTQKAKALEFNILE